MNQNQGNINMSQENRQKVCAVEIAGGLDNSLRRFFQNPHKLLSPFLTQGMTALDLGCGPGFFTIEMAKILGRTSRVIAADLQQGMLEIVAKKIEGTELEDRITLHKCSSDRIGLTEPVDFVFAFFMVHEVPSREKLFSELNSILKPNGRILVVEPPIHVSKSAFKDTLAIAEASGLEVIDNPKMPFCKTALLSHKK
jgi:ubiquinone/menaquinone biosynthesis C-methylase UbiE